MGYNQRKGATFEQDCANYFEERGCDVIRKRPHGKNDQGDLHGVTFNGRKVTVECKNKKRMELSEWLDEAESERINDGGDFCIVIHKRKGKGTKNFGETYVTMTLDTFCEMGNSFKKS
jgi:Holliday junction resolvase - archaeal type